MNLPSISVAHVVLYTDRMRESAQFMRPAIDHDVFTLREPAGHAITFFSSHATTVHNL